eukprot:5020500-Pleurochrysis_carterae.AAC.5
MIILGKELDLAKVSYGEASSRKANAEAKVVKKASILSRQGQESCRSSGYSGYSAYSRVRGKPAHVRGAACRGQCGEGGAQLHSIGVGVKAYARPPAQQDEGRNMSSKSRRGPCPLNIIVYVT